MNFHDRLRREARKTGAVITDDPGGVLAALQITKRLVTEARAKKRSTSILPALDQAIPLASVKDPVRAWWASTRILLRHTTAGKSNLAILTDAIEAQGKLNILQAKGPRP